MKSNQPVTFRRYFVVSAVVALSIYTAQPAMSTKLSSTDYYAKASKDIAKDTVLTPANITIVPVTDSDQIPRGSMWLATPNTAFGFAVHNAVSKGNSISGRDLIQGNLTDLSPHPEDPLWLKYAKSAIVTDKKLDFATSQRYDAGMLAELNKIGDKHQKLVYQEQEAWVMEALRHSEEVKARYKQHDEDRKKDSSSMPSVWDAMKPGAVSKLESLQKKMVSDQVTNAQTSFARSQKIYSVVTRVFPPTCQLVVFTKEELDRDRKDVAEYTGMQKK